MIYKFTFQITSTPTSGFYTDFLGHGVFSNFWDHRAPKWVTSGSDSAVYGVPLSTGNGCSLPSPIGVGYNKALHI